MTAPTKGTIVIGCKIVRVDFIDKKTGKPVGEPYYKFVPHDPEQHSRLVNSFKATYDSWKPTFSDYVSYYLECMKWKIRRFGI